MTLKIYFKRQHFDAEVYKQLCLIADKIASDGKISGHKTIFKNFIAIEKEHDIKSNFKAAAFKKDNEIIVCFVGTDPRNIKDHITNLKMGIGKVTKQMKLAIKFIQKIKRSYPFCRLVVAGHSEGGSEALYTGLSFGIPVYSYNGFSLSNKIKNQAIKNNGKDNFEFLINNYRNPHDIISKLFYKDLGSSYIVENQNTKLLKTLSGFKAAHTLLNMGNCQNAVPIDDYKKSHPLFVDKISRIKLNKTLKQL